MLLDRISMHKVNKKCIFLFLILLAQIFLIVYYNLTQHKFFLGYDASVYYLQIMESAKQGTFFLDNWSPQTTLALDSSIPLATLFYKLSGDPFFSLGLANLIFIVLFSLILYGILKYLNISSLGKLLFFILLFTPYISNPDGTNNILYFFVMYFASSAYLMRVLIIFLIIYTFHRIDIQKFNYFTIFLAVSTLLLSFYTGVSSGYFVLIFGIAPVILFSFIRTILLNHLNKNTLISGSYIFCCAVVSILGRIFTSNVLHFEGKDSLAIWTSLSSFWNNLFSIFTGYLSFTGSLPFYDNMNILSIDGIGFAFRIFIAVTILFCGVSGIYFSLKYHQRFQKSENISSILSCVILCHIVIFILCYTTYGNPIFETRYLIVAFISFLFLGIFWCEHYVFKNKNKYFLYSFASVMIFSLFATNVYSYAYINQSKYPYELMTHILEEVKVYDSPIVYIAGEDLNIIARNLRVLDDQKIYKYAPDLRSAHHWGDYTYYDDTGEYQGSTILLATDHTFSKLPIYHSSQYRLISKIPDSDIGIYYSEKNPVDLSSEVNHSKNIDYFYSPGIATLPNSIYDEDGFLVINGDTGFVTWGPYVDIEPGIYEFTLYYDVFSEDLVDHNEIIGFFDISSNASSIKSTEILSGQHSATVQIQFDNPTSNVEYRTMISRKDMNISLKYIEISKIG